MFGGKSQTDKSDTAKKFFVWKTITIGRYFGTVQKQTEQLRRSGLFIKQNYTHILSAANDAMRKSNVYCGAELDLVRCPLRQLGLTGDVSFQDIARAAYEHELDVYEHDFSYWLWLSLKRRFGGRGPVLIVCQPARVEWHDYVPRIQMKFKRPLIEAAEVTPGATFDASCEAIFVQSIRYF